MNYNTFSTTMSSSLENKKVQFGLRVAQVCDENRDKAYTDIADAVLELQAQLASPKSTGKRKRVVKAKAKSKPKPKTVKKSSVKRPKKHIPPHNGLTEDGDLTDADIAAM